MKKNKLTKAERLAAYKAEKAAEKAKIERWEQLAKYLSTNCMLVITNIEDHFYHDAMLLEKKGVKVSLDEIGRNLRRRSPRNLRGKAKTMSVRRPSGDREHLKLPIGSRPKE